MKLFKLTRKFHNEEDGAVTVDWVVLTAAVVGLAAAALATIRSNTASTAEKIGTYMGGVEVPTN